MVFAAPDLFSSGAAYALCHQQSPSPSPSQSSENPQSSICNLQSEDSPSVHPVHSDSPIPGLPALPSTADIDALATVEDLNGPAQLIHYAEAQLQQWAAANPAAGAEGLDGLKSFTLLLNRITTTRKNTLARRESLLAEKEPPSQIPNPQSDIPHSAFRIPHSTNPDPDPDAASYIPDPVDPNPDLTGLRSLRAWLRQLFVSGHFSQLDQILRLCCFEAWEDLLRNDPKRARQIMTCWPYPDGREPPLALLHHWFELHSPEYLSERYTLLHGTNNEGYGVSWFHDGRVFVAYNREPDAFRMKSSAGVPPAFAPANANAQSPSPATNSAFADGDSSAPDPNPHVSDEVSGSAFADGDSSAPDPNPHVSDEVSGVRAACRRSGPAELAPQSHANTHAPSPGVVSPDAPLPDTPAPDARHRPLLLHRWRSRARPDP